MAVATLLPDGDITTDWNTTEPDPPTTHYTSINEGTDTPSDVDYNETPDDADVDECSFEASPADVSQVTQIVIKYRGKIDDVGATATIELNLFHSAGTPVSGNPQICTVADFGGTGNIATVTKTWPGLTLTKAEIDSVQLRQTFNL